MIKVTNEVVEIGDKPTLKKININKIGRLEDVRNIFRAIGIPLDNIHVSTDLKEYESIKHLCD